MTDVPRAGKVTALEAGDGDAALRTLRTGIQPDRRPLEWRFWDELLRGLAFQAIRQPDSAAVYLRRAADPHFMAGGRIISQRYHLAFALRQLAETEDARGNPPAAAEAYGRLLRLWSEADPELRGDVTAIRAALARITETERP